MLLQHRRAVDCLVKEDGPSKDFDGVNPMKRNREVNLCCVSKSLFSVNRKDGGYERPSKAKGQEQIVTPMPRADATKLLGYHLYG